MILKVVPLLAKNIYNSHTKGTLCKKASLSIAKRAFYYIALICFDQLTDLFPKIRNHLQIIYPMHACRLQDQHGSQKRAYRPACTRAAEE